MKLLGIELTPEQFDFFICEQNKGKELKVVNGVLVAVEHEITARELNEKYESKVAELIRAKYSLNSELAILRQRDTKPTEFAEYNAYAEQCKKTVKAELGI